MYVGSFQSVKLFEMLILYENCAFIFLISTNKKNLTCDYRENRKNNICLEKPPLLHLVSGYSTLKHFPCFLNLKKLLKSVAETMLFDAFPDGFLLGCVH